MNFLYENFYGLANLSVFGYVVVTLLWLHVTMMAVTLYYHRDQAHRSVDLHPVVRHICRFWLWMNTGSSTREWVAVHRKHHAHCEKEGDPHSPRLFGLKRVLLEGAELYRVAARDRDTLEKYAKGTPNDWLENNLYHHPTRSYYGIALLVVAEPRVVRRSGHHHDRAAALEHAVHGGRHRQRRLSREGLPELRDRRRVDEPLADRNSRSRARSCITTITRSRRRRASRCARHEVDMGWLHLKVLVWLGLAKIRRVADPPQLEHTSRTTTELDELRAIIVHRMHVLRHYTYNVTLPVLRRELESFGENANSLLRATRRHLSWQPEMLDESSRQRLDELAQRHPHFKTVLKFRSELKQLWEGAHTSNERLLAEFREWCTRAEQSGIQGLEEFVAYLKSFRAMREPALV